MPENPNTAKAATKRLKGLERQLQVLRLKRAGATYEEIGQQLGISRQAACAHARKAMAKMTEELAEEVKYAKALQRNRIEDAILVVTAEMRGRDSMKKLQAAGVMVRLLEREAALLGLDAPKKLAETDSQGNDLPESARDQLRARMLAGAADAEEPGGDPHP